MKKIILAVIFIIIAAPVVVYFAFPRTMLNLATGVELMSARLTEKSMKVGPFTISYLEGGNGENVVLLHGYTAEKSNWVRFAKYITRRYHVVIPDLPGFGQSSHSDRESYTIAAQARWLDAFASALGLTKFHLAGNSMGGGIAGRFAAEHPDRVLSLGLFDSLGVSPCPQESRFHKDFARGKNDLLVEKPEDMDRVMALVFFTPPAVPRPIKAFLAEQAIASRAFNEKIRQQLTAENYVMEPDFGKITARTLILWGDKDNLIDVSCVGGFEKGLVNHTTVIMKDCGHIPMLERPKEAAAHYLKFIRGESKP